MNEQTIICLASHILDNSRFYQAAIPIAQLTVTPSNALAVTTDGKVYMWGLFEPMQERTKAIDYFKSEPKLIKSIVNSKITQISCINSAALLLSTDGTVFSMGEDIEKNGILGLGGINFQTHPTIITALIDQRIKHISICQTHASAVSTSGRLYTWGTGNYGQLGHKGQPKIKVPQLVETSKIYGIKMSIASYNYTAILTSGGYVYFYGSLKNCTMAKYKNAESITVSTDPKQIESLMEYFITVIKSGEGYICCINKAGLLIAVDSNEHSTKLCAKQVIKDFTLSDNKIYGIADDGNSLYEWKAHNLDDKSNIKVHDLKKKLNINENCKISDALPYIPCLVLLSKPNEKPTGIKKSPQRVSNNVKERLKGMLGSFTHNTTTLKPEPKKIIEQSTTIPSLPNPNLGVKEGFIAGVEALKQYIHSKKVNLKEPENYSFIDNAFKEIESKRAHSINKWDFPFDKEYSSSSNHKYSPNYNSSQHQPNIPGLDNITAHFEGMKIKPGVDADSNTSRKNMDIELNKTDNNASPIFNTLSKIVQRNLLNAIKRIKQKNKAAILNNLITIKQTQFTSKADAVKKMNYIMQKVLLNKYIQTWKIFSAKAQESAIKLMQSLNNTLCKLISANKNIILQHLKSYAQTKMIYSKIKDGLVLIDQVEIRHHSLSLLRKWYKTVSKITVDMQHGSSTVISVMIQHNRKCLASSFYQLKSIAIIEKNTSVVKKKMSLIQKEYNDQKAADLQSIEEQLSKVEALKKEITTLESNKIKVRQAGAKRIHNVISIYLRNSIKWCLTKFASSLSKMKECQVQVEKSDFEKKKHQLLYQSPLNIVNINKPVYDDEYKDSRSYSDVDSASRKQSCHTEQNPASNIKFIGSSEDPSSHLQSMEPRNIEYVEVNSANDPYLVSSRPHTSRNKLNEGLHAKGTYENGKSYTHRNLPHENLPGANSYDNNKNKKPINTLHRNLDLNINVKQPNHSNEKTFTASNAIAICSINPPNHLPTQNQIKNLPLTEILPENKNEIAVMETEKLSTQNAKPIPEVIKEYKDQEIETNNEANISHEDLPESQIIELPKLTGTLELSYSTPFPTFTYEFYQPPNPIQWENINIGTQFSKTSIHSVSDQPSSLFIRGTSEIIESHKNGPLLYSTNGTDILEMPTALTYKLVSEQVMPKRVYNRRIEPHLLKLLQLQPEESMPTIQNTKLEGSLTSHLATKANSNDADIHMPCSPELIFEGIKETHFSNKKRSMSKLNRSESPLMQSPEKAPNIITSFVDKIEITKPNVEETKAPTSREVSIQGSRDLPNEKRRGSADMGSVHICIKKKGAISVLNSYQTLDEAKAGVDYLDLSNANKPKRKGTDITPGPDPNEKMFDVGTTGKEEVEMGLADPKELDSILPSPKKSEKDINQQVRPSKFLSQYSSKLNKFINSGRLAAKNNKLMKINSLGRYNHKRFMEAFSNAFIKYYKEMQAHETPKRNTRPMKGNSANSLSDSIGREFMDTDCHTDISKIVLERIDKYKHSKIKGLSLMKQNISNVKINSQFARRSQNISPNRGHYRSFASELKSTARKDRSTLTPCKNYIMLNKNFVEQVSRINHEINIDMVEPNEPRYKFPRPETLLNLVHFNDAASPQISVNNN